MIACSQDFVGAAPVITRFHAPTHARLVWTAAPPWTHVPSTWRPARHESHGSAGCCKCALLCAWPCTSSAPLPLCHAGRQPRSTATTWRSRATFAARRRGAGEGRCWGSTRGPPRQQQRRWRRPRPGRPKREEELPGRTAARKGPAFRPAGARTPRPPGSGGGGSRSLGGSSAVRFSSPRQRSRTPPRRGACSPGTT